MDGSVSADGEEMQEIPFPDWKEIVDSTFYSDTKERQSLLVFSLIMSLDLSLHDFLYFLFDTEVAYVKQRVGIFMGYHSGWTIKFGPAKIFNAWHTRFPRSRKHLNELIVKEYAKKTVLQESNAILNNPDLRVQPMHCDYDFISNILKPDKLSTVYSQAAPFLWDLMDTFTTSPNEYRKRKARKVPQVELSADEEKWEDDELLGGELNDVGLGEAKSGMESESASYWKAQGFVRNPTFAMVLAISMMAFTRNTGTNLFPLILGLFLEISGTSSRVINTLSNAGITVSISTIERMKKILSDDAKRHAVDLMESDSLFFSLMDNINIFLRKFQQRLFNKNSMINATNIVIVSLPDAPVESEDLHAKLTMRGRRALATGADIVPTEADDEKVFGSFEGLIVQFIVAYCPGNNHWEERREIRAYGESLMAKDRPLTPKKTDTRPLGVFDVNEGSKAGMIKVLKELQTASGLSEEEWSRKTRIIAGDWLTSNNFRGARRDRSSDVNGMERLEYGEELSQLFHFALNATHMLMRIHFGNAILDPGSLAKHKGLLNRTWDAAKPNYADAKALIRHSLIARILYSIMVEKGMTRWSELAKWKPTLSEIRELATLLVDKYATPASALRAKEKKDDIAAHSIYFIRDALLFCEFEHAVSHADAGRILRVFKYWAFSFRGAGLHNYARECLEVVVRWKYELTPSLQAALEQSWFVNRWGLPGRWIASDLYLEQLNFWVKRVFIAKGSGVSLEYIIDKGSACVEVFRQISHDFVCAFGRSDRSRRHKEVDIEQDLRVLCEDMLRGRLHDLTFNRKLIQPARLNKNGKVLTPERSMIIDAFEAGAEILNNGKFKDFIRSTTWDPAIGYPLESVDANENSIGGNTGTSFDQVDENPLSVNGFQDVDDGENLSQGISGLGSLGGGVE